MSALNPEHRDRVTRRFDPWQRALGELAVASVMALSSLVLEHLVFQPIGSYLEE